jgi:osmotically inducible protein OsmC
MSSKKVQNVLYRGSSKATGGRDGKAVSSDGVLDVKLTTPKELGGGGGDGTNPEQLFAAGYSACFIGAMKFVANRDKIKLPADVAIDGTVGVGPIFGDDGKTPAAFGIEAELKISLPGMDKAEAQKLGDAAHLAGPYSNATRGNINVTLTLV